MQPIHERNCWQTACSAKHNSAVVVISGRSDKYRRGMVEMVVCSHAYPTCYVARFIRVLDQCNTVGALDTNSSCQRRAVVDIFTCLCHRTKYQESVNGNVVEICETVTETRRLTCVWWRLLVFPLLRADTTEPDHFFYMFPSGFSWRKCVIPQA